MLTVVSPSSSSRGSSIESSSASRCTSARVAERPRCGYAECAAWPSVRRMTRIAPFVPSASVLSVGSPFTSARLRKGVGARPGVGRVRAVVRRLLADDEQHRDRACRARAAAPRRRASPPRSLSRRTSRGREMRLVAPRRNERRHRVEVCRERHVRARRLPSRARSRVRRSPGSASTGHPRASRASPNARISASSPPLVESMDMSQVATLGSLRRRREMWWRRVQRRQGGGGPGSWTTDRSWQRASGSHRTVRCVDCRQPAARLSRCGRLRAAVAPFSTVAPAEDRAAPRDNSQ